MQEASSKSTPLDLCTMWPDTRDFGAPECETMGARTPSNQALRCPFPTFSSMRVGTVRRYRESAVNSYIAFRDLNQEDRTHPNCNGPAQLSLPQLPRWSSLSSDAALDVITHSFATCLRGHRLVEPDDAATTGQQLSFCQVSWEA